MRYSLSAFPSSSAASCFRFSTGSGRTSSHGHIMLLLYLVIVICLHGINCFQRFSEQPKYTEVNPGQDALLTCKVIDKRGTCSWQKDNKPVGIYAKKYEWAARPSSGNSGLHLDLHPPPMQIGGDCSLWIRSATLDFDDGLWECQVTASDFTTQDALTSQPVRLVVRVAPQRPRLEYEGVHVPPGHNITVDSGALATVKCVSHYGNPPATLKWYLGDQEIAPIHEQKNSTEPDNSRTWSATSVVQATAMRERHGDILRCMAFHESYSVKSVPVEARLDIKYAPTIRLIGSPEIDLEEDKDALILRCVADANPPASIVWRRAGRSEIASLQETLQLRPVGRRDAGLYTCQAQNSVGTSEQLSVQLDVKYPPKIISAGPDRLTTAPLFSPAAFECVADGNPMPTFKWVQRISHGSKYVDRGNEPRLVIDNVTYDYQGEYECHATSYINGQERLAVSEPISLQVVGAPQVLRLHPSMHTVSVKRGEPASLSLVVCADPHPHRVAWEWGSLRLEAGSAIDRFHADDVVQDSREDCYLSTLHILRTDEHDSRPYYLVVENERGTDRHAIHLNVEEPLEMSYLLGIVGGCMTAISILICLCFYAIRSKSCCFKGSSGYKSSDKDSEKADLKSRSDSTSGGGPQADSIYTTPAGFHHQQQHHHPHQQHPHPSGHGSPEAMKDTSTTKATASVHDNYGNLLWQQEAAEFVEKFPQIRQRLQVPLRQSVSAGALYNKHATPASIVLNKRSSGGELLTAHQRHQRDMFSGDLGIPEINTHVGSVVHTFETIALQRRLAKQEKAAAEHQQPQSKYFLPSSAIISPQTSSTAFHPSSASSSTAWHHHGTSNNKYNQLKRKTHESRQKIMQQQQSQSQRQLLETNENTKTINTAAPPTLTTIPVKQANNYSTQALASNVAADRKPRTISPSKRITLEEQSNLAISDHYRNIDIDEDYRKNLFGTIPSQKSQPYHSSINDCNNKKKTNSPTEYCNEIVGEDDEAIIVNAAFEEIFAGYSGADNDDTTDEDYDDEANVNSLTPGTDENMVSLSELDDDVFKSTGSSNYINNLGCPGHTPNKLIPPLVHKKGPPPPPPTLTTANNNTSNVIRNNNNDRITSSAVPPLITKNTRPIIPLSRQKQRSITLTNLFERLKSTTTTANKPQLSKIQSDNLLTLDQLNMDTNNTTGKLHKFPPQMDLHRETESRKDSDFLRGSTLSQSFVRHLKMAKTQKKAPAPQPPVQLLQRTKKSMSSSSTAIATSKVVIFPYNKRSKSFNELLLDDLAAQLHKYQRHRDSSRTFVDGKTEVDKGIDSKRARANRKQFSSMQNSAEI